MSVDNNTPTVSFYFEGEDDSCGDFMTNAIPRVGEIVTVGDSDEGRDEMVYRKGLVVGVAWTFTHQASPRWRKERWVGVTLKEMRHE